MSVDKSNLKYNPRPLTLRINVRIENWWHGHRDRKNIFNIFCHQTGVEYPPVKNKKYSFPDSYRVTSDWVEYLGKMRDKLIANHNSTYVAINKRVQEKITETKGEIAQNEQFLDGLKNDLQNIQSRLKSERAKANHSPIEIITLEAKIKNQKSKIANSKTSIEELKTDLEILEGLVKSNKKSWQKQVEIIDALVAQAAKKYSVYVTKRINSRFDYASFECILPDYSEKIKGVMEE